MSERPVVGIREAPLGQRAVGQDDKRHRPSKTGARTPFPEDDMSERPPVEIRMAHQGQRVVGQIDRRHRS